MKRIEKTTPLIFLVGEWEKSPGRISGDFFPLVQAAREKRSKLPPLVSVPFPLSVSAPGMK